MFLILKNKKKIQLSWNFLCVEYAEEYPGGLNQLQKDFKNQIHPVKTLNRLISAIIRANYEEPISYEESIRLVNFSDYDKIIHFIEKETNLLENYKKKETTYRPNTKHKKRK